MKQKQEKKIKIKDSPKNRLLKFKNTIFLLPNLLTFFRIFIVPVIVYLIYMEWNTLDYLYGIYAAIAFIAGSITDYFDGYYARKMKMKSTVGKIIDPLADKLMVISILIMLVPSERVPASIVVLIMAREFIITALRTLASAAGIIIAADKLGKYKTFFQMLSLPLILINLEIFKVNLLKVGLLFLYISTFFSILSAYFYMRNFFKEAKELEF